MTTTKPADRSIAHRPSDRGLELLRIFARKLQPCEWSEIWDGYSFGDEPPQLQMANFSRAGDALLRRGLVSATADDPALFAITDAGRAALGGGAMRRADVTMDKYSQRHLYRGFVIEQCGLQWKAWLDFVTERHEQPRFDSLAAARVAIKATATAPHRRPPARARRASLTIAKDPRHEASDAQNPTHEDPRPD